MKFSKSPAETQIALIAGKTAAMTIRFVGAGLGSNLPGRIARKLSSHVLSNLSKQARKGAIAVTGTNGKSTTSGFLSSIFRTAGLNIVHNRQGANLVTGITASLVDAASWDGKINADYCLFEIDEAALPIVAREVDLTGVVVTNLFRDQLDRFGELDTTARLISAGIATKKSHAILNADDANVSQLAPESSRTLYGIESVQERSRPAIPDRNMELSYCSKCGKELSYETVFYGQLGHWKCGSCGHRRPRPDIYATDVELRTDSSRFVLCHSGRCTEILLPMPGLFNVYNALAATACANWMGVTLESIVHGLKTYDTLFGRSERFVLNGRTVYIQLIKNPAGTSQAVSAVVKDPNAKVLVAINDNLADGRDISWLWDADFESLAQIDRPLIVSGLRAEDMAVRMKYAGLDNSKITCVPKLEKALIEALSGSGGETLWILPTYTCLLELQKILKGMGHRLAGT